jgi:1-acyl-sn-glycerol-3-phosphate acyltransferase
VLTWLLSALYWSWLTLSSIVLFVGALVVWLLTVLFDRRLVALHLYTSLWASLYVWTNPAWKVTIRGRDKIRPGVAYVMVSNHQSLVDILAVFGLFVPFKWVSKIELFSIPIIGWNMRLNRYIALRRGDSASIEHMYRAAQRALAQGCSVFLFPEGTRSETADVRPFKHGAFVLAQKMKVPILPLSISGSHDALPKKSLMLVGHHHITVSVLDEIPHEQIAACSPDELAERVRERIRSTLGA